MEPQALHKASVKFALDLHPSASGDVMEGIRDQLNALLLRYSATLEGVLVSYTNPRILSQQARIHPFFPYFHLDVSADCVLFKPRAGHILDGKVHMVSHDFIGLLMLGLFNVSIGRQKIRADLSHDAIAECWRSEKHDKHRISLGSAIRFKVDRVDDESEFFTLGGSLLASGTGEVGFVTAQANKKAKKRRRSEAVATDAPVERQHAQALQQSRDQTASRPKSNANAAAAPNSNANSAAAPKSNATSAAAAKSSTHTAAAGPASAGNAGNSKGSGADIQSPKKKKRRKRPTAAQDLPNGATSHQASANPGMSKQAAAVTDSNAAVRDSDQDAHVQQREPSSNGVQAGSAAGEDPLSAGDKQKPRKKRKGDIDKETGQAAVTPAADQNHVKQKSHKKKKGQIDKAEPPLATASGAGQSNHQQIPLPSSEKLVNDRADKLTTKKSKKRKSTQGNIGQT